MFFCMHGQNYHHIETLLLEEGNKPRWAQLYIYDTEHEIQIELRHQKMVERIHQLIQ
jgi:hypothetical protein